MHPVLGLDMTLIPFPYISLVRNSLMAPSSLSRVGNAVADEADFLQKPLKPIERNHESLMGSKPTLLQRASWRRQT